LRSAAEPRAGRLARLLATQPPGPFERRVWRSPLRGPWLASVLSVALLVLFGLAAITGYLSNVAYQPGLGTNSVTGGGLDRHLFGWTWPTSPAWLYAFTQGIHVVAGVAAIPILAAKLWAVIPKFYKWPPVRTPAEALERLSIALLVGSSIFLLITGVLNIAYWYQAFLGFSFVPAHFYAAFVFVGALLAHLVLKLPVMVQAFRERGVLRPLLEDTANTKPEPFREDTSAPLEPAAPTISRRGLLGVVAAASGAFVVLLGGESIGGWARRVSLLAPRSESPGADDGGFQVNKTAAAAGIDPREVGPDWRLEVLGARTLTVDRGALLSLPQHTYSLPIGCVEGWSTTQRWTGVRLRDLARMAGVSAPSRMHAQSVERVGQFNQATLNREQVVDARSLLALKVNGRDLPLDHGFPARVIAPAVPGVHNTKWVARLTFS
jgi:DMSO/TMAO reductase YedYZ molybdopterin-dependent catalytic subunit